ncbi:MAG: hypothetical protein A2X59_08480 [Nitrospirae bacterium GWC2_42_7]|nr:MAG: hypothetical protein A2X59_08480 [Nitrospirae bacterium GWC2_42_7]
MKRTVMKLSTKRRTDYIHVKNLMERIILQSIEDLWVSGEKDESIDFFRGEGFAICAYIAGLKMYDKVRLADLISKIINFQTAKRKNNKMKNEALKYETLSLWNMKLSTASNQKNSLVAGSK